MDCGCGLVSAGSGDGLMAASCEYNNELSESMKGEDCIDQMSDCQFPKDSVSYSKWQVLFAVENVRECFLAINLYFMVGLSM